jgi:hypothetical protein
MLQYVTLYFVTSHFDRTIGTQSNLAHPARNRCPAGMISGVSAAGPTMTDHNVEDVSQERVDSARHAGKRHIKFI